MKEGPDIALVASLIGDPARANMLSALLAGKALTATELAAEAGITAQTASSHLKKLEFAQLIAVRKQGRHKYFVLADDEVGHALEALMGLAARRGLLRTRTGPKDPSLRKARICYNHLAGDLAVKLYEGLLAKNYLSETSNGIELTNAGHSEFVQFGINMEHWFIQSGHYACHAWIGVRDVLIWPGVWAQLCFKDFMNLVGRSELMALEPFNSVKQVSSV
nr:winged helix-turn-helix domain-containing protein [Sneathiella glossodoripedis]